MLDYLNLLSRHGRVLAFGFLLTFLSSFGQTFFISLFSDDIRAQFHLTHGAFGSLYSLATLVSGLLMIWAGGIIDRVTLPAYGTAAILGLGASAALFAWAPHWGVLAVAIFGLRLFGQGMLSHTAVTGMARRFDRDRGKAIGFATLGYPAGEAMLPTLAILLAALVGWTNLWWGIALLLLATLALRPGRLLAVPAAHAPAAGAAGGADNETPDFDRRQVLRDWRFYLFLPTIVAPAAIGTGFFFHQLLVADNEGWPLAVLTLGIGVYALVSLVASLVAGGLIDRLGAVALTRLHLLPMAAATAVIAAFDGAWTAPVFFALLGVTAGANGIVVPSVWAELYGTRHLGAIRALGAAIMVVATAITPGTLGLLVDAGVTIETIGLACTLYTIAVSLLNTRLRSPRLAPKTA